MKRKRTDSAARSRSVMHRINSGEVRLRPKWHFVAISCAIGLSALAFAVVAAYVSSLVVYWLRIQTADTMAWGARYKLASGLADFPWWALITSLLASGVSSYMLRTRGTLYKIKLAYIWIAVFLIALTTGLSIAFTRAHSGPIDAGKRHSHQQSNHTE